ncbi:MAG: MFS transporter [Rhodospirillaceae bacterium]|nr:MFS transporter [Rhodospirillaceae bacterium]
MRKVLPSVTALLLGYLILVMGHGLVSTLLSLRAVVEGMSTGVIGLIVSSYYAGFVVGTLHGGRVIGRAGHVRAFAAFAALACISILALPVFVDATAWIVMRLVAGYALAGLSMVTESWLNATASNENRGQVLSLYGLVIYLGIGLGQYLLVLDDIEGYALFSLAAALFAFALVPVAMTRATSPGGEDTSRFGFRALWTLSPLGVVGCLTSGLIVGGFTGMAPVFGKEIGLDNASIATFIAAALLGGFVLQYPLGRLSDRWDRRWVITISGIGIGLASLAMATLAGRGEWGLFALSFVFGGFAYTLYSLSIAHANDFIATSDLVKASAGLLLAFGIGAAIGPFAASLFMGILAPSGLFLYTAAAAALCTIFAIRRMTARAAVQAGEREPFVALPQRTALAYQLDPRGEHDESARETASDPSATG